MPVFTQAGPEADVASFRIAMGNNQEISWKRVSVEGLAIVTSILLAFAIDAWWQERLERNNESEQLARLHAEFVSNGERIGEYLTRVAGGQRATEEIFLLVQDGAKSDFVSIEVPILLLQRMLDSPTFEPDTPVYDSLIRSGQQVILKDRRVITSLANWERSFRNYIELAIRTRQNMDAHLIPALARRGDLGETLMSRASFDTLYELEVDPSETVQVEIDEELGSLLAERYQNGTVSLDTLDRAQNSAEQVIEAIEAAESQ